MTDDDCSGEEGVVLACRTCGEVFSSQRALDLHERMHMGRGGFKCEVCGRVFSRRYNMLRHVQRVHGQPDLYRRRRVPQCEVCGQVFTRRGNMLRHALRTHGWTPSLPRGASHSPASPRQGERMTQPGDDSSPRGASHPPASPHQGERTGASPHQGERTGASPHQGERMRQPGDDSAFQPDPVHPPDHLLPDPLSDLRPLVRDHWGSMCRGLRLPAYLRNNKGLYTQSPYGPYKDQLSLFRCLAVHLAKAHPKRCENLARQYQRSYLQAVGMESRYFRGVPLKALDTVESLFHVNIQVYQLVRTDNCLSAQLVHRSAQRYASTMRLNLHQRHYSYIKDMQRYTKSYQCPLCHKTFATPYRLRRHGHTCTKSACFKLKKERTNCEQFKSG